MILLSKLILENNANSGVINRNLQFHANFCNKFANRQVQPVMCIFLFIPNQPVWNSTYSSWFSCFTKIYKMYTKNLPKILHYALLSASKIGATSILFNYKRNIFFITQASRDFLAFTLFCSFNFNLFTILRTLEILFSKGGNSNPDFHICYVISYSLVVVNSIVIFVNVAQDDLCLVFNQVFRYGLQFSSKPPYV